MSKRIKVLTSYLSLVTMLSTVIINGNVVFASDTQEVYESAKVTEDLEVIMEEVKSVEEMTALQIMDGNPWWIKLEGEEGSLMGNARIETFSFAKVVSFLDNGEGNAVTLNVTSDFEGEVEMSVRYRSGELRNLCYKVNNGLEQKIEGLNSGSWASLANSPVQTIHLQVGENTIKFYGPAGENGPGIDYITLSRNGGEEPKDNQLLVNFQVDNIVQGDSIRKLLTDTIYVDELPDEPVKEGKDFLGWYWGPNAKYEAIFPMDLSNIPIDIIKSLGGNLTFVAKFGNHTPENPIEKEGYRLIFNEEFDTVGLDTTKWVDRYLSSWSTTASATNEWTIDEGIMNLQIKESTQPWCPEYDGATVVAGFTTGQRNGLHNWNRTNQVRNPEDVKLTHINQYGYYEMRAKTQPGSSRHSAWWLTGFEDVPQESAEIDIFEVLGRNKSNVPPAIHKWNDLDAFGEPGMSSYTNNNKDFHNEYHVYGFDWQQGTSGNQTYPDKIVLYVDGVEFASKAVNIDYPMIQLISLYEKREGGWTGGWEWMPYPNSFEIDYVRVYKKLPEHQLALSADQLQVQEVKAENLNITKEDILLKTYEGCEGYVEKHLPGTKSYVRVLWNDGIETQEAVQWEPITQEDLDKLKQGEMITKEGYVPSIGQSTFMDITVYTPPYVPYTMENLVPVNGNKALEYLFDGQINDSNNVPSGEFKVTDYSNDKVSITYDFQKDIQLSGIDFWTNYGESQGISMLKVAVWDEEAQAFSIIQEAGTDKIFNLNWQTAEEKAEKQSISFDGVSTSKVKIIILSTNYKWNKFAMREIEFQTEEIAKPEIVNLELVPPTKIEYLQGEQLDTTGMKVTAIYSNQEKVDVTEDVTITGFDSNIIGEQTLVVTYKDHTKTFEITVNLVEEVAKPEFVDLKVKAPKKKVYQEGEQLDTTGMKVTAIYSNQEKVDVTEDVTITGFDSNIIGEQTLVVTYEDHTKTFEITVNPVEEVAKPELVDLKVKAPKKKVYQEGEQLDTTGMRVTAIYSNQERVDVTEDVTITGFDSSIIGEQILVVTYEGHIKTFEVMVNEDEEVEKPELVDLKVEMSPILFE